MEAGISIFEKYRDINTLESLSNGDVTRWDEIKALPYEDVFLKQLINKDRAIFNRRYSEVVKSKNK